ncbi:RNA-directed DNA polymerase [Flavobacterium sp. PL12]|uniref:RNA-directed DNA polymerase n=1 Tax=Flavobacterium sp. PL12 TaxID=3071718 RepID=UPI00319DB402
MRFSREYVDSAYRKLKSYVYYDNFSLLLRQQLAEFEAGEDFDKRLDTLVIYLNMPLSLPNYFSDLLKTIGYDVAPKKFDRPKSTDDLIISNNFTCDSYDLHKVNYFFKGEIELHIISILWILEEGYTLHTDYCRDNYAYFLELDSEKGKVVDGLRLFKPYFDQYQRWRDRGIDLAKRILEDDTDVVIISLDIKEYYYNIVFGYDLREKLERTIRDRLNSDAVLLTPLLFQINDQYSKVFPNKEKSKSVLPIGLLSSGILANWYLKDFDSKIKSELSPAYYGRYVDDIQIVLSNTKIPKGFDSNKFKSSLESFMDKFFVQRKIFNSNIEQRNSDKGKIDLIYSFCDKNQIEIQKEKIAIYSFESKESRAVLDMFKKKIEQNSSAFWFLPNEDSISDDFDESVYELTYSDTINKLRSVIDIKQSKYGASIFLAKKIKVSLLSENSKDEKTTEQILTFFKGIVNLEFSSIWEKVLTYFVITNDKDAFWQFYKETITTIDKIGQGNGNLNAATIVKTKEYLGKYLMNCCAMSLSLNSGFIDADWWKSKCLNYNFPWLSNDYYNVESLKRKYIYSNLLRNSFVVVPLLNYLKISGKDKINFINYNYLMSLDILPYDYFEFDEHKLKYAPRFIYFYEFNINKYLKELISKVANKDSNFIEVDAFQKDFNQPIYDESFNDFFKVNYEIRNMHIYGQMNSVDMHRDNLKGNYFSVEKGSESCDYKLGYNKLIIPYSGKLEDDFRIAVANVKVSIGNISNSLFKIPDTSKVRRKELIDILNDAEKVKADALILPEVSVPHRWIHMIADESRRKQRLIIVGLEHIRMNNICYNLLVTCLPFEQNGIKDVVVNFRLKNHYSPEETKLILKKGFVVPMPKVSLYNLFVWKGVNFANYNCYELADINHRSLFKSKVDLLFASEYNADVNYFSNIVETVSRDIHCYFVQVNNSDFGDSRITAPKKTESKDILKLKGGENNVILLGKIDINKLRNFQKTRVFGQDTSIFKNTPPHFDHDGVENR